MEIPYIDINSTTPFIEVKLKEMFKKCDLYCKIQYKVSVLPHCAPPMEAKCIVRYAHSEHSEMSVSKTLDTFIHSEMSISKTLSKS